MNFSTTNIIWDILNIENVVVHLSSLNFQLHKTIWFVEIWKKKLQITLIWLWNDGNLSIYDYVTPFVPNIRHKPVRLWYGTLVRFLCSEIIDEGTTSIVCKHLRIWRKGTGTRVVRVYYPPQVLIIDWFSRKSDTNGSRHKVPVAATRHI